MKERVTFVHQQGEDVDPSLLKIQKDGISGPTVQTTREDRLTIPLTELPSQVLDVLKDLKDVHVKWVSPLPYTAEEPFVSRVSPGLHVSFTPADGKAADSEALCGLLQTFGEVDCLTLDSFIESQPGRSASAAAYYLHHQLEDLRAFSKAVGQLYCSTLDTNCKSRTQSLSSAASMDLSFDQQSKTAKLRALWPRQQQKLQVPASSNRRTEVGIMESAAPANMESHELGLSGVLTVLGEHKEPSPVMFAFPARHRSTKQRFTATFPKPTGLHPTLKLSISSGKAPVDDLECNPFAYLTLPNTIFADRYQLDDVLFLESRNLTASSYTSLPVDLEAPAYTTKAWGSNLLVQLAPPSSDSEAWTAEVPLHLRYLEPSVTGKRLVEVPYPALFWACDSLSEANFAKSPFDDAQLGYDELFEPGTTFWHVAPRPPAGGRAMSAVSAPVLKVEAMSSVETGTSIAITIGFFYVLWKLISGYSAHGYGQVAAGIETPTRKK